MKKYVNMRKTAAYKYEKIPVKEKAEDAGLEKLSNSGTTKLDKICF